MRHYLSALSIRVVVRLDHCWLPHRHLVKTRYDWRLVTRSRLRREDHLLLLLLDHVEMVVAATTRAAVGVLQERTRVSMVLVRGNRMSGWLQLVPI